MHAREGGETARVLGLLAGRGLLHDRPAYAGLRLATAGGAPEALAAAATAGAGAGVATFTTIGGGAAWEPSSTPLRATTRASRPSSTSPPASSQAPRSEGGAGVPAYCVCVCSSVALTGAEGSATIDLLTG